MNYTELVQSVNDIIFASAPDEQWASNIPRMIEAATLRIFRDLEPLNSRRQRSFAVTVGDGALTGPTDCWTIRSVFFQAAGQNGRKIVTQRAPDFVEMFTTDVALPGIPKYWSLFQDTRTIKLAPVPSVAGSVIIDYTGYPEMLSDTVPENYISIYYPDLMLYACIVYAAGYARDYGQASDDPKLAMSWETRYQTELAKASISERQRKSSGVFDQSITPPPSSGLPTG